MHPEQLRIYRAMTPAQKLEVVRGLYNTAWQFKAAGLRLQHPEWTEEQIESKVREIFINART